MLFLVVGPPAAGKTTWVSEHAQPGDLIVDYDALANALSPHDSSTHDHSQLVKDVTRAVRRAAIDAAVALRDLTDVYVIHSTPSERMLAQYDSLGARVIVVDPGYDVVMQRAAEERPRRMRAVIAKWYDTISKYVVASDDTAPRQTWVAPKW